MQGVERKRGRAVWLAVVWWMVAGWAVPVGAQFRFDDGAAEAMVADALTRAALGELAGRVALDEDARVLAEGLLGRAVELDGDTAERWRLRATLAQAAGRRAEAQSAWAAYARLRPGDDAALLALIQSRLAGEAQTLDARLEALDKLVRGGSAAKLPGPVRSRLAWSAFDAAAEVGNPRAAVGWLTQAATLDPFNAPAAAAVFDTLYRRGGGARSLGPAAKNWVEADPGNPDARLALANVLLGEAVYMDASQQFANASRLSIDLPLSWSAYGGWAVSLGAISQADTALALLEQLDQMAINGVLPPPPHGPVGVPVDLELVRLVLLGGADHADQQRDRAAIRGSFERAVRMLEAQQREDPAAAAELAWVLTMFADDAESAAPVLEQLGGESPRRQRAMGWKHLRQGRTGWARDAFEPLAQADPLAKLGLALLLDGSDPTRARWLRDTVRMAPRSLAGLLASRELQREGRGVPPTADGEAVQDLMRRTPGNLWRLDLDQSPWLAVDLSVTPARAEPFEPVTLTIGLRNQGATALSLAGAAGLRPLAFVDVALFDGGDPAGTVPTQVVDLGRSLVLTPGQRITVEHRLDWSALGQRFAEPVTPPLGYAVQVMVDPRVLGDGRMVVGPLGVSETARGLSFAGARLDDGALRGWMSDLSNEDVRAQMVALARLASLGQGYDLSRFDPALLEQARELLVERAAVLPPAKLAWVVWHLNRDDAPGAGLDRLVDLAQRSQSPIVRVAYLFRHVDRPDDPAYEAVLRTGDPALRRFAQACIARAARLAEEPAPATPAPATP